MLPKDSLSTFLLKFWQKRELFLILFLIALHCMSVFRIMPPSRIADKNPLFHIDFSLHFYRAAAISHILSADKAVWGYDPYFAAGYPIGLLEDFDNRACELFVFALSSLGLNKAQAFKLFIIIVFLSFPLLIYLTAINFSLTKNERILTTALAVIFWYGQHFNFIWNGMFSFLFSSFLYMYIFSLFYRYLKFKNGRDFFFLTILSSLIILIHLLSIFCLFIPMIALYLLYFKKLSFRFHLSLLLGLCIVILINSYSIYPFIKNMNIYLTNFSNDFQGGIKNLIGNFFFKSEMLLSNILVTIGVIGLFLWRKNKEREIYLSFLFSFLFMFALIYFGKYNKFFSLIGTYRFNHYLIFLLIFPASSSLIAFMQFLRHNFSVKKVYTIIFLILFLFAPLILSPLAIIYSPKVYVKASIMPQKCYQLIKWVKDNTTSKGRILLEIGLKNKMFHFNHFSTILLHFCQREIIGGPQCLMTNKYLFANFYNGLFFEKPIASYSDLDMKDYLKLYNIKWIIVWTPESTDHFDKLQGFVNKIHQIDNFSIYQANQNTDYFLKGKGKINVNYNRIWISNASEGEVVIKYHWLPTLKTDPPLPIECYNIEKDPIGFIKVKNGDISNFLLYNSYE
jgi:hypothetical protein